MATRPNRIRTVRAILADLVAEQQGLDQYLQSKRDRDWKTSTPAAGWNVHDQVSHLAFFEEYAYNAIVEDGTALSDAADYPTAADFTAAGAARGRQMRPGEVIEWWRGTRAKVVDALSRSKPEDRIPWFVGDMSAKAFATARLMETWAHGLDIHAAFKDEVEDGPRIRHIAWLGWRALPYAFQLAGEVYSKPVRVEVIGPAYAKWVFGPEDTDQLIKGPAGDWCRVAVQRMKARDSRLTAHGDVAEKALLVARAYA